ncbi:MAG: glycosyltransferase [Saprospiraceae bacterium]|nr:glycosyltransferase [Saprospiraceae bacterium]
MPVLSSEPLFSIITVCYNAVEPLRRTLQSVQDQDFSNYEHLVIDGASHDGTLELLQSQTAPQLRWISEPDQGLYDAMNKGQAMARGQFVWFVNAGDLIEGREVLSRLAQFVTPETDILYGDVLMVNPDGDVLGTRSSVTTQKTPDTLSWKDLRYGMVVSHQAFLPRVSICTPYISENLCADIDWVIKCLKKSRATIHTHMILARFETGGLSRQRHRESLIDRYHVLQTHFGWFHNLLNHCWILLRAILQRLHVSGRSRY